MFNFQVIFYYVSKIFVINYNRVRKKDTAFFVSQLYENIQNG